MNWASLAVCTVPGVLSAIASDICYLLKTSGFTIHPAEEETPSWRQTEVKGYTLVNPPPPKMKLFLQFRALFSSSRIGWCHVCISATHKKKRSYFHVGRETAAVLWNESSHQPGSSSSSPARSSLCHRRGGCWHASTQTNARCLYSRGRPLGFF